MPAGDRLMPPVVSFPALVSLSFCSIHSLDRELPHLSNLVILSSRLLELERPRS